MTNEIFQKIIEKYCKYTKTGLEINLTPIIGEPLLDEDIIEKFDFLETLECVRNYFIVTNLLHLPRNFYNIKYLHKLNLLISVIAADRNEFVKITGKDMFNEFVNNLIDLANQRFDNIELLLRVKIDRDSPIYPIKHMFRNSYQLVNNNIAGLIPKGAVPNEVEMPEKKGICLNALYNSITPDGMISICDNADYRFMKEDTIIGNAFEDLNKTYGKNQKLYDIVKSHYQLKYPTYCQKCNEYEEIKQSEMKMISLSIPWLEEFL
jgi:hypothetical protein